MLDRFWSKEKCPEKICRNGIMVFRTQVAIGPSSSRNWFKKACGSPKQPHGTSLDDAFKFIEKY